MGRQVRDSSGSGPLALLSLADTGPPSHVTDITRIFRSSCMPPARSCTSAGSRLLCRPPAFACRIMVSWLRLPPKAPEILISVFLPTSAGGPFRFPPAPQKSAGSGDDPLRRPTSGSFYAFHRPCRLQYSRAVIVTASMGKNASGAWPGDRNWRQDLPSAITSIHSI